jgi:hypothetical protein
MSFTPDGTVGWLALIAAVVWVAVGLLTLTMPLAFAIWLFIGVVIAYVAYSGGVRIIKYGRGDSEW